MKRTKKLTFLALTTCFALILSYIESIIPPFLPSVPGIKIGITNIVILFLLYRFSFKEAMAVSFLRLILSCLLFTGIMTFVYSFAGAVLSLCIMAILKKTDKLSKVGVSIAGSICHNLGQVIVAIIIMQTAEIGYYMAVLTVTGVVSGAVVGIAGALLLKYTDRIKI